MKNDIYNPHTSTIFNAEANLIALLSYLASTIMSWIPIVENVSFFAPLIIFFIEQNSTFVKFHSMQAFLLNIISSAITLIYGSVLGVSSIGVVFGLKHLGTGIASAGLALIVTIIVTVLSIVILVYNIIAMIKAHQYQEFHIPYIGDWAARITHTEQ